MKGFILHVMFQYIIPECHIALWCREEALEIEQELDSLSDTQQVRQLGLQPPLKKPKLLWVAVKTMVPFWVP